jgi:hypothetical protein
VALILVVCFMAIAAVMAYALLAGSLTQVEMVSRAPLGSQADAMAQSGVDLAAYYILNPLNAPTLSPANTSGSNAVPIFWPGGSGVTYTDLTGTGSSTVSVASDSTNGSLWTISSTGTYTSNGSTDTKTISATLASTNEFQVKQALASNSNLSIGNSTGLMTITNSTGPAIVTSGSLSVGSKGTVTGSAMANSFTKFSGTRLATLSSNPVPTYSQLTSYQSGGTYGSPPTNFIAYTLSLILSLLLPPQAGNPNIQYYNGNATISQSMTVSGTVIVNGNLTIGDSLLPLASTVSITPSASGFPALIVKGTVSFVGTNSTLNVSGLTFMGGGLGSGPSSSGVTINGGLLIDQNGISSSFAGTLNVTYNSANVNMNVANCPVFTSATQYYSPASVNLSTWTQ